MSSLIIGKPSMMATSNREGDIIPKAKTSTNRGVPKAKVSKEHAIIGGEA